MSIFSFLFKNNSLSLDMYPDAVIVFSKEKIAINCNAYAKNLFDLNSVSNLTLKDLFDCDTELLWKELLTDDNMCTLKIKDTDVFVEAKAIQKKDDKIIISFRDVTQKHKTVTSFMSEYESSKKTNRTKNNLLIKLSNDLVSPLHSITGFSQAMLEGLSGDLNEKQKRYLSIINKNAFDLLAFIDNLVEGAKLETNSYEFALKNFDIIDMANGIVNDVKEQNQNIKTFFDFSRLERRTIYTDDQVLRKVIFYLINHLLKSINYGELSVMIETPDLEFVQEQGFLIDENSQPKSYLHIEITTNVTCQKPESELSMFEIYPQLEINAKREVINNLPLYNASLLCKYIGIKLCAKGKGKSGFDIIFNVEKP